MAVNGKMCEFPTKTIEKSSYRCISDEDFVQPEEWKHEDADSKYYCAVGANREICIEDSGKIP